MASGYLPIYHKDHPATRVPYSGWVQEQPQQPQEQGRAYAQQDRHTAFSTHGLQLKSAYFAARGAEPPLTNKHKGFAGCLDYIWVSRENLRVVEVLAMPYECMGLRQVPHVPEAVPFPPIPNRDWPSDHLALAAKIQWTSG
jgi:CCR4-NOT transcription complex subunit 6